MTGARVKMNLFQIFITLTIFMGAFSIFFGMMPLTDTSVTKDYSDSACGNHPFMSSLLGINCNNIASNNAADIKFGVKLVMNLDKAYPLNFIFPILAAVWIYLLILTIKNIFMPSTEN
jgi:hypothetical protein